MAEEKLDEVEQPLPSKRKHSSDIESPENSSKIQKVEANSPSSHSPNTIKPNGALYHDQEDEEADEEDYEEDEDDDEDEDEDEDEGGEVDRKGKGIMKEDVKGKGKLIEESETDSSDDDDAIGSDLEDDDSELDEDPLAEVDLDNILPSRTRGQGRPPPRAGLSLSRNDGYKDQEK